MKLNRLTLTICAIISVFAFASCNDNERRADDEQSFSDSIRMVEEERLEQERMDRENNSVFRRVQEDTSLTTFSRTLQTNEVSQDFLEGEGPYTIFAPSNTAFEAMPQERRDSILNAQYRQENNSRLYYLVIDEELTLRDLQDEIEAAGGTYTLTTMQGEDLSATLEGDQVVLADGAGNTARVTESGVEASNGIVHVVDAVLAPRDISMNAAATNSQNRNNQNNMSRDTTRTNNSGM